MKICLRLDILVFVSLLALSLPALGCRCVGQNLGFIAAAADAAVIAKGTISSRGPKRGQLTFEVQQIYRGETAGGQSLNVWAQDGRNCGAWGLGEFPPDTQFIFALRPLKSGDYYLHGCGTYWLRISEDYALGRIKEGVDRISVDVLRTQFYQR
jgi:hypothetical protein